MTKNVFTAKKVNLILPGKDEFYEVITPLGERIASFRGENAEEESDSFADALNDVCKDAPLFFSSDIALNV